MAARGLKGPCNADPDADADSVAYCIGLARCAFTRSWTLGPHDLASNAAR